MDENINERVENAARCFRLAAECTDRELARRLVELGREYCDRAVALGADPTSLPQLRRYGNHP